MLVALQAICASSLGISNPDIDFSYSQLEDRVEVQALISDREGDLASATLYAIDKNSSKVIWTEHRIIEGRKTSLNFTWPLKSWWAGNGTDYVGPVLAVNTIGLPPEEAPYEVFSAPAVLKQYPRSQDITSLAYFDQDGVFHSLMDLAGANYYKSRELLEATDPGASYGWYVKNNLSLWEGETSLRFFSLYLNRSLVPYPPLMLERSPIQHYTIFLERRDASEGRYLLELEAEDSQGQRIRKISELTV
jgi:hypothetical protein